MNLAEATENARRRALSPGPGESVLISTDGQTWITTELNRVKSVCKANKTILHDVTSQKSYDYTATKGDSKND